MQIWQAAWHTEDRLLLWAERSLTAPQSDAPREGMPASLQHREISGGGAADPNMTEPLPLEHQPLGAPPLPGALSAAELQHHATIVFELEDLPTTSVALLLPTRDGAPVRSPRVVNDGGEEDTADAVLTPWSVAALALSPLDALAFLSSIPAHGTEANVFDDSLRFWREATKLLLDLLTRGRFLPTLSRDGEQVAARWQPLITEEIDLARLTTLAAGMPLLATSVLDDFGGTSTADDLLSHFIDTGVNTLVRIFLRRLSPFAPAPGDPPAGRDAVGRAWLRALATPDGVIQGHPHDLIKLETRLRLWSAPVQRQRHFFDIRTALRLNPPLNIDDGVPMEEQEWTVELVLESSTDSRLRISAQEVWEGERGFLERSAHSDEELESVLLRDLGRAMAVFPPIRRALKTSAPSHFHLNVHEVYDLLRRAAGPLIEMGIGVVLPNWWVQPTQRLGLSLTLQSDPDPRSPVRERSHLASEQLLDFSWKLSLGDHELSDEEFAALVAKQVPLAFIKGEWIELDPEKIRATIRFLEEQKLRKKLTLFEALHLGLGADDRSQILPVTSFEAEGWVRQLLDGSPKIIELLEDPNGFHGALRPYQREGLTWLSFHADLGLGVCLADDMGLGKTVQFLALLQHLHLRRLQTGESQNGNGAPRRPMLLIVPMSILANWEQESRRFTPDISVYVHHGTQRLTHRAFLERAAASDLVITTYSIAFRDEELLSMVEWSGIALDEAQNIKNLETKQTRAVRRLCYEQLQIARGVRTFSRFALTGTPLENRLDELWSIFDFLNPGFLGNLADFRSRYAVPIERQRDANAAAALSRLLRPFVLRRLKSDPEILSDLPEKLEMNVVVPLTAEQAALYQTALEDMFPQLEAASGIHRKGLVLATITRLKQICDHPALLLKDGSELRGRSHKIAIVEELLETMLAEGDKVLLFTQFAQLGHLLQPYLAQRLGTEVLFLHGGLSRRDRDSLVTRFQTPEGPKVFLLSLKAGGFGLNLTEANQVIHLDQWWNPAVENQATDRVYRIGQKRNVQVRKIICQGTLEERIAEMLQAKRELADQVVGSTKESITKMSTDELRKLLELGTGPQTFDGEDEYMERR